MVDSSIFSAANFRAIQICGSRPRPSKRLASHSYEAFQEAFRLFPGEIVPHDPETRWQQYDAANRSARNAINRKLWQDDWDHLVEKKVAEFIRQHAAELLYLDDGE